MRVRVRGCVCAGMRAGNDKGGGTRLEGGEEGSSERMGGVG